jgi:hypothetical protein
LLQLSINQEAAIDLLLVGKHDQEVANTIGVHRVTVTRWRLYHPGFRATLNERRTAAWQASQDTYRGLVHKALHILQGELENPGPQSGKLALEILRSSPLPHADFGHPGPTDPDAVVDEFATVKRTRETDRMLAMVTDADRAAAFEDLVSKANEPPGDEPPIGPASP